MSQLERVLESPNLLMGMMHPLLHFAESIDLLRLCNTDRQLRKNIKYIVHDKSINFCNIPIDYLQQANSMSLKNVQLLEPSTETLEQWKRMTPKLKICISKIQHLEVNTWFTDARVVALVEKVLKVRMKHLNKSSTLCLFNGDMGEYLRNPYSNILSQIKELELIAVYKSPSFWESFFQSVSHCESLGFRNCQLSTLAESFSSCPNVSNLTLETNVFNSSINQICLELLHNPLLSRLTIILEKLSDDANFIPILTKHDKISELTLEGKLPILKPQDYKRLWVEPLKQLAHMPQLQKLSIHLQIPYIDGAERRRARRMAIAIMDSLIHIIENSKSLISISWMANIYLPKMKKLAKAIQENTILRHFYIECRSNNKQEIDKARKILQCKDIVSFAAFD